MLSDRQAVHFVKVNRIDVPLETQDAFTFRPDLGWHWLQRFALGILIWIGAYKMDVETTFTRTPEENDDLLKSLLGQEGQWIEFVHDYMYRPRIYMGPDEEMELVRLSDHLNMHPFTLEGRIKTQRRDERPRWHDIPITVVPWMKGAVIVPDNR